MRAVYRVLRSGRGTLQPRPMRVLRGVERANLTAWFLCMELAIYMRVRRSDEPIPQRRARPRDGGHETIHKHVLGERAPKRFGRSFERDICFQYAPRLHDTDRTKQQRLSRRA
jgi:hypothetical protein